MIGEHFQHEQIRRLISVFGTLFDDMSIARRGEDGELLQVVHPIPIEYGPRDKFLEKIDRQIKDSGPLKSKAHETYPRMAYEMTGMSYSPGRALPRTGTHSKRQGSTSQLIVHGNPAPWDVDFDLHIAARNAGDAHKIVEQIIFWFRPQLNVGIVDHPVEGEVYDLPLVLSGLNWIDEYEGDFESIRRVVFTLSFVAQYRFHGPAGTDQETEVSSRLGKTSQAIKPGVNKILVHRHSRTYGYYGEDNIDLTQEVTPDE